MSPYEVKAGTIIPTVLLTGLNSDLPGQLIAQVREPVFDTETLVRVFGNSLLLSVISAGVQLSQIPDFGRGFAEPTAGKVLGASVGQQLGQTSGELIRRGINVAPTIEIRPGYAFNVMVTPALAFPGPYDDRVRP